MAQWVNNSPAMQETRVSSLGHEGPLEKERATHSSILGWKIRWTEEPGRLQPMGSQRVGHNLVTKHTQTWLKYEDDCDFGNKRPLYKKKIQPHGRRNHL